MALNTKESQLTALANHYINQAVDARLPSVMQAFYEQYDEILESFRQAIETCADAVNDAQAYCGQGSIGFISFSILRSSILLGEYTLRIDFLDRLYGSENETASEWKPDFMVPYLRAREQYAGLQKLKEHEQAEMSQQFAHALLEYMPYYLAQLCKDSADLLANIETHQTIYVLFGDYLQKVPCILKILMPSGTVITD